MIVDKNANRIDGFDFARALAIFGMIAVNFKLAMGASENGSDGLIWFADLFNGRAAALFVVLAGVGISLTTNKARLENNNIALSKKRMVLFKRAFFLFVVGLLYTPVWPADILHFYGIYILIGAFLIKTPDKFLLKLAAIFMMLFPLLLFFMDYSSGWNWKTLTYTDFWTASGIVRHLFFNGFHPVIPWLAFLIFGIWLGRQNMADPQIRSSLLKKGLIVAVTAELVSTILIFFISNAAFGETTADLIALVATEPMPPVPFYILAGTGTALTVICLSITLTMKYKNNSFVSVLNVTGKHALTHYVAHVIIGMGVLETLNMLDNQSLLFSLFCALLFSTFIVLFSYFWDQKFNQGPLEIILRKLTTQ